MPSVSMRSFSMSREPPVLLWRVCLIAIFGTAGSYTVQAIFLLSGHYLDIEVRADNRFSPGNAGHPLAANLSARASSQGWKFSWRNQEVRPGIWWSPLLRCC